MTTMRFRIEHQQSTNLFYADVVEVASTKPWSDERAKQIAAGKSARWATTCANRAMKAIVEAEWKSTEAHADLSTNYAEGTWRSMAQWRRLSEHRHSGAMMISFTDPKDAMRFKLAHVGL